MTTVYCAICGQRFETDDDHVEITAQTVWIDDRDEQDEFVFHVECWDRLSDGWARPT